MDENKKTKRINNIDINKNCSKFFCSLKNDPKFMAAVVTFILGIAVHLFGLVNVLHNHDNLGTFNKGYGFGVTSGRWALTYLGEFMSDVLGIYNLPYFNGVLFIFFLAISVWFILDLFDIKSKGLGIVMGFAVVTFPSVTCTLFFKFTSHYYGIAILLAVLAVWFLERFKYGWIGSVICTAVSLGIYQAFLPFTIALMILKLLQKMFDVDYCFMQGLRNGVYYCLNLIGGLGIYYVIMQFSLRQFNVSLDSYQGISDMGKMGMATVISSITKAYRTFFMMPFYDYQYCVLAYNNILKISYQIMIVLCLIMAAYLIYRQKNMLNRLMSVILISLMPLAMNFIVVMCPESTVYTLMVMGIAVLLFIPVIFYKSIGNNWKIGNIIKKAAVICSLIITVNYAYQANANYHTQYYANRQMENYISSMVTQVRMTEGYKTNLGWAFIGDEIKDPLYNNITADGGHLFGGNFPDYLNSHTRDIWFKSYIGYDIPFVRGDYLKYLSDDVRVKEMPCWPDQGSIKVIDDVVVIKLQD